MQGIEAVPKSKSHNTPRGPKMLFSVWVLTFMLSVGTGLYSSRRYLRPELKRRGRHTLYQAIAGLNYVICVLSFLLMCGYLAVQHELECRAVWLFVDYLFDEFVHCQLGIEPSRAH